MNNKKKNILLGTLIVGVLAMTVAFAALATNLTINGTANVAATKWNIRFENWVKANPQTAGGHTNTAVSPAVNELTMQDNSNVTKVSGINVTLNQPGDIAKYTFEIANRGTIAAKLDNFTATDTSQNSLVNQVVKCYESSSREGTEITTNYVLGVEQKVYCYLVVSYKDQTNSQTPGQSQIYSQEPVSTSISASWTWTQADESSAQSGENTPVAQWDNYIAPTQKSGGSTLPAGAAFWIQENTSTEETELCGSYPNGIVCFTAENRGNEFGTQDQNGNYVVTGDTLQIKNELERAGATISIFESSISGSSTNNWGCQIHNNGTIGCSGSAGECHIMPNIHTGCS